MIGRMAAFAIAGISIVAQANGPAANSRTSVTADGHLQVPAMDIPPSTFLSAEFLQAYKKFLVDIRDRPPPPPLNAPKAEWDKFDAIFDRVVHGDALKWLEAHDSVKVEQATIGDVHVGIFTPKTGVSAVNRNRILINLHGGGFFYGRGLVAMKVEAIPVAGLGRIKVIGIDYRMAPYAKFPAASEDVEKVYRALLENYKPEQIGIYGCSAGGTLAGQAIAWLAAKGLPRPGAVGIFCAAPVAYGEEGDSSMWGVSGMPAGPQFQIAATGNQRADLTGYYEGIDVADPLAYPGNSDTVLAKFPPTLLLSGTRSREMSAAIVAHARFLKLGVDSSLYLMEGGWHGAHVNAPEAPETRDALSHVVRWFDSRLAK